jgi:hypothetical protein
MHSGMDHVKIVEKKSWILQRCIFTILLIVGVEETPLVLNMSYIW